MQRLFVSRPISNSPGLPICAGTWALCAVSSARSPRSVTGCAECVGYGAGHSQGETTCACFYRSSQPTLLLFRVQLLPPYGICHVANLSAVGLTQVLAGLHFLHGRCRIIHADIKPENVLLYIHDKNLQRFLLDAADCGQRTDLRLKAPGEHCGFYCNNRDRLLPEMKRRSRCR